ncbi:MAG TPA: bifunctional UDP-N-acetylglucosamine diphosphorylase/glucosamine-1-phosphate N-acetyltransferase GlmU [Gammaproteobacteria bacterium]|nr:bifunctional UDP-N-acetylglucosamine diphosphorylase/glucosamine-1-phosphate N-acetyltransferase GlmU [Gammaproteobacteria bacterium]
MSIIILAAGQGKRMHSDLPKVLQPLGGATLLEHVVQTALALKPVAIHVVYGHGGERVPQTLSHLNVKWVLQAEQLGTGHAVMQAMPAIPDSHAVLVLYGDVPLVRRATLRQLTDSAASGALAVLSARLANPSGYGRIVRDGSGHVARIVEHKDANAAERAIDEINTGLMACAAARLRGWLEKVGNHNAQQEYYLTDVIAMAVADKVAVEAIMASEENEVAGVNDRRQLADAEKTLRERNADALMQQGVTLRDPARIDVRGTLECGRDVSIDVNCVFEGRVKLGNRVRLGPGAVIRDCEIGDDTEVLAYSVLDGAQIGARVRIGPFARIRPESELGDETHVGNFVEIKKSKLGHGSKANHLAYVGDAQIGKRVNVSAGVITCNYDGVHKHTTIIGDDAFIGSDSTLIAPVKIGDGAYIAAGSAINQDAPAGQLSIARARQTSVPHWQPPKKHGKKD